MPTPTRHLQRHTGTCQTAHLCRRSRLHTRAHTNAHSWTQILMRAPSAPPPLSETPLQPPVMLPTPARGSLGTCLLLSKPEDFSSQSLFLPRSSHQAPRIKTGRSYSRLSPVGLRRDPSGCESGERREGGGAGESWSWGAGCISLRSRLGEGLGPLRACNPPHSG